MRSFWASIDHYFYLQYDIVGLKITINNNAPTLFIKNPGVNAWNKYIILNKILQVLI